MYNLAPKGYMITIEEELLHLQTLLKLEQEEDRNQYKLRSTKSPISERKKMGLCWYPVTITKTEIGFGNKVVVEIERTSTGQNQLHLFQTGKGAQLFTNASGSQGHDKNTLTGVITELKRNKLKLATTKEDLPDWIDDGKLGIDLTFDEMSYKEMEIALRKVLEPETSRLASLRDILLGAKKARFNEVKFKPIPDLNSSQNAAVKNIMEAQDVAIIHGPPGTGKTTTLVQAILETLKSEKRLLVCAPSNTAVDLLTEKLAAQGVNVIRMGNPSRVSDLLLEHTLDAQIMAHKAYKDLKNYRKTAEEYKNLAGQYKRQFGWQEREQRRMYKEESKKLLYDADMVERYITDDLLDKVQVITCTLVGAANRVIRHLHYDTVFMDEAAQALEPAAWIPITRANRVILAGDHCQLPPTVKSSAAEAGGLTETLFEKCIERQPEVAVMLQTQYRMHRDIMQFSNQQFYRGELEAHDTVHDAGLHHFSEQFSPDAAIEFIDTAGCGFTEQTMTEGQSVANPEEADLMLHHLLKLVQSLATEVPNEPFTIGVIAPYRAQINYLKDAIEHIPDLHALQQKRMLSVGTVDSFQGQERDIIYISMVRSNDRSEIGFLSDIRRMNVGMTRARKKLVVVGDSATLTVDAFYQEFLDYVTSINAYKSAWEIPDFMK